MARFDFRAINTGLRNIFLIISCILGSVLSIRAQSSTIKIRVPHSFTGWAYLVGDTLPVNSKDNTYDLDTNGVVYLDAVTLTQLDNVRIYKDGQEITYSGAKLLYSFQMSFDVFKHTIEIPVVYFYVLSAKDISLGEDYWNNEENKEKVLITEGTRRDYLINAGVIKLK